MSRRWLLFLFCLALPLQLFVQLVLQALARRAGAVPRDAATRSSIVPGSVAHTTATEEKDQLLTPSSNLPQSISGGSQPSTNAATAQSGIAQLPAPTPPANQTNDTPIRSGLLFLLKEKDRYGVWYSTQAMINLGYQIRVAPQAP